MSVQEQPLYIEMPNEMWNITKPPIVDNSTRKREYITILDKDGGSAFTPVIPNSNRIEFNIRNNNVYFLLKYAYLKVKLRLVRSNGDTLNQDDIVALSNNVGFTLFQSTHFNMNNRGIQSVDHVTMLRLLTKRSKEELATTGPEYFFFEYPDDNVRSLTAGDSPLSEYDYELVDKNEVVNAATNKDIIINLPLKYMFSFVDELDDLLIRRADIDFVFDLTTNTNKCVEVVSKAAGYNGGFIPWIKSMKLKMPSLLPSTAIELDLLKRYNNEEFSRIIYNNTFSVRHNDHTQGSSKINWRVTTLSGKLNSIFFMFKIKADENNENKVCNVYDNALVRLLFVRVGSIQIPLEHIECDFKQDDYSDAYVRFIEATKTQYNRIDEQSIVSWDNYYSSKYPKFFVDLSALSKTDVTISEEVWLEADLDTPDQDNTSLYHYIYR